MRRVLISLFWNPARTARSCWYPEGEIVKSDKSPSQIRNPKFWIGRTLVQLQISDLGFKMQDSSDFQFPRRGGEYSLQRVVRNGHRAPHMRDRAAVVAQAFVRDFEVAADDVDEWIDFDNHTGLKRIKVVYRNQSRFHVPLVAFEHLVIGLDVR